MTSRMITRLGIAGLAAAGLLLVSVAANDAKAGGVTIVTGSHHHESYGDHRSHHAKRYHKHRKHHHRHAHRHHHHHRGHDKGFGVYLHDPAPVYRHSHRKRHTQYRPRHRACHEVTKVRRSQHGRGKVIAGTMCYDRYGEPYIVRGSRRVIGYVY